MFTRFEWILVRFPSTFSRCSTYSCMHFRRHVHDMYQPFSSSFLVEKANKRTSQQANKLTRPCPCEAWRGARGAFQSATPVPGYRRAKHHLKPCKLQSLSRPRTLRRATGLDAPKSQNFNFLPFSARRCSNFSYFCALTVRPFFRIDLS